MQDRLIIRHDESERFGAKRAMFAKEDVPTGSARQSLLGRMVPKLLLSTMMKIDCYAECAAREVVNISLLTTGIITEIGTTTIAATAGVEGLSRFM